MGERMKKLALVITTLLCLTACQERPNVSEIEAKLEQKKPIETKTENKPSPTDALKALDQTLSANKVLSAKEIKFETVAYNYELPEAMKQVCGFDGQQVDKATGEVIRFCTEIDIKLAKIDPIWMEQIVNKKITGDDSPKLLKFKQNIDEFVGEHLEYIHELKESAKDNNEDFQYAPLYVWMAVPEILPSINNVAQVVISSDVYMGGAHGLPNAEYLIFDMDLQSQIVLNDVLEKNKQGDFYNLAYDAFKVYLEQELGLKTEQDIKEYGETWQFDLPENFYFDKKGINLVYQPYQMGGFAQGFIELNLPYETLAEQSILKTQYLPQTSDDIIND